MNQAFSSNAFLWLAILVGVLVGLFIAQWEELTSFAVIGAIIGLITLPLVIRFYHPLLIILWNAMICPYFLPGAPHLWMLVAYGGLVIALVLRGVDPGRKFLPCGAASMALVVLALLLIATAVTSGVGARVFQSDVYGFKKYFAIGAAIAGFFVLISKPIKLDWSRKAIWAFFLPGTTALISNLALIGGEKWFFLYWLFPVFYATYQLPEIVPGSLGFGRLGGGLIASYCLASAVIVLYGVRGVLDLTRPWRFGLLLCAVILALFSGFRIALVYIGLILLISFVLEGLYKTRWLPITAAICLVVGLITLPQADKLPLPVQRAISFLPIELNPVVRYDAEASVRWRVSMWEELWPEVGRYFWWGKGFAINANAWHIAMEGQRRGIVCPHEIAMISGDYHNGFLGLIIPLGVWGVVVFVWFLMAGLLVLYRNYRRGPPELATINRGLFVLFLANTIIYFAAFGSLDLDLQKFTGILGLGIALNGYRSEPKRESDEQGNQMRVADRVASREQELVSV